MTPAASKSPTQASLPRLIGLARQARTLQLRATRIHSRLTGNYLSRIKGRGMEFDESRVYQPGDDARNIDWRVTARTGVAHTKVFREERERPVLLSIDNRAGMRFATRGVFKSVIAAELAALLGWAAVRQGDRVGGEVFDETTHIEYRPGRGRENMLRMLQALSADNRPPGMDTAVGNQPAKSQDALQDAYVRLQRLARPGSLVCVISDFHGLDTGAERALVHISRHCEVLLLHVFDILEARLPDGGHYRARWGGRVLDIDANAACRERYRQRFLARQSVLEKLCRGGRMQVLRCCTEDSPFKVLQSRFSARPLGGGAPVATERVAESAA